MENQKFCVIFLPILPLSEQDKTDSLFKAPISLQLIGNFQKLKSLNSPYLCSYVEIIRGKRHVSLIQEFHMPLFKSFVNDQYIFYFNKIIKSVILAHLYLLERGIVNPFLNPNDIVLDNNCIKLSHYGIYHMSKHNQLLPYPLYDIKYLSPESMLFSLNLIKNLHPFAFLWSLGVILLEFIFNKKLYDRLTLKQQVSRILSFLKMSPSLILKTIVHDNNIQKEFEQLPDSIVKTLHLLLQPIVLRNWKDLSQLKAVFDIKESTGDGSINKSISNLSYSELNYLRKFACDQRVLNSSPQCKGSTNKSLAIITMPSIIKETGNIIGLKRFPVKHFSFIDIKTVTLDVSGLHEKIKQVPLERFFPTIDDHKLIIDRHQSNLVGPTKQNSVFYDETNISLKVKEIDFDYQLQRLILYKRLLRSFPYRTNLIPEAKIDIFPFFRGHIWARLLDVSPDHSIRYNRINKCAYVDIERQIEVDIPRCHQYNEILASPLAHQKFKNILKAWVLSHPSYVYWQGLDSLSAPFLYLHFNEESLAYACFERFIDKYLGNFFYRDNSHVIREYACAFNALLAFHDPDLYLFMRAIHFDPELFAIPWFLTVFAHVLPLPKIFHLWDSVLVNTPSYPLFLCLAFLNHLRAPLLTSGFNEAILLFSDVASDIDVESRVQLADRYRALTPDSVTYRIFGPSSTVAATTTHSSISLNPSIKEICLLRKYRFYGLVKINNATLARHSPDPLAPSPCRFNHHVPFIFESEIRSYLNFKATDFSHGSSYISYDFIFLNVVPGTTTSTSDNFPAAAAPTSSNNYHQPINFPDKSNIFSSFHSLDIPILSYFSDATADFNKVNFTYQFITEYKRIVDDIMGSSFLVDFVEIKSTMGTCGGSSNSNNNNNNNDFPLNETSGHKMSSAGIEPDVKILLYDNYVQHIYVINAAHLTDAAIELYHHILEKYSPKYLCVLLC